MKHTEVIVKNFIKAMEIEISRLEKVHARVGDEWPPWFDPNDISIYDGMIKWLRNLETEEPQEEYINSKPYWFMMEVVGRYVNENIDDLTDSDINEITTFCNEYDRRIKA